MKEELKLLFFIYSFSSYFWKNKNKKNTNYMIQFTETDDVIRVKKLTQALKFITMILPFNSKN